MSFHRCCQSQNYKIWKQFTTGVVLLSGGDLLLSITKLQNLKAIHNEAISDLENNKVVVNHKTTKFESNSQRKYACYTTQGSCCQSQNYKIWKQFTTYLHMLIIWYMLLSITKLQNLKAIHNGVPKHSLQRNVVVNHKTTKFESNSQPKSACELKDNCCCQSQNYKIWKQFTTKICLWIER